MLDLFTTLRVWVDMKLRDERGAITIEYGILVVFIALAVAAAVGLVGDQLELWFTQVRDQIATWAPGAGGGAGAGP